MYVALPCKRQQQLLASIFAAAEKLEKGEKRNAPVLENKKAGVFILNQPVRSISGGLLIWKGVIP